MIDKDKPEPRSTKQCCLCSRTYGAMKGRLIHWPDEDSPDYVTTLRGEKIRSFSFWAYECQWCRAAETRRKKRNGC